jgi:hypothetical protein
MSKLEMAMGCTAGYHKSLEVVNEPSEAADDGTGTHHLIDTCFHCITGTVNWLTSYHWPLQFNFSFHTKPIIRQTKQGVQHYISTQLWWRRMYILCRRSTQVSKPKRGGKIKWITINLEWVSWKWCSALYQHAWLCLCLLSNPQLHFSAFDLSKCLHSWSRT